MKWHGESRCQNWQLLAAPQKFGEKTVVVGKMTHA
jgi:hypothetical protein